MPRVVRRSFIFRLTVFTYIHLSKTAEPFLPWPKALPVLRSCGAARGELPMPWCAENCGTAELRNCQTSELPNHAAA